MGKRNRQLSLGMIGVLLALLSLASAYNFDDSLEDLIAEESIQDEEVLPGAVLLPPGVFNDGKPFFVERDPSTGVIDFNHKKTVNQIDVDDGKPPSYSDLIKDSHVSDTKDVILQQSTPNFHDFLNLPKVYSPANFVSISSSYANLKYQGSNKGTNHRDHSVSVISPSSETITTTTTTAPKYYLTRQPAYTLGSFRPSSQSPTTQNTATPSGHYTFPATSGRPITTSTTATSTTTDAPRTTVNPQKQLFTRYPYKSTIKNKYLETSETRKKFFLPSTLALPSTTSTTTTTTTTTTEAPAPTPLRSSTYYSPSVRPQRPLSSTVYHTAATYPSTIASQTPPPSNPVRFVDTIGHEDPSTKIKFTMPALKYEGSRPAPFRPMPSVQGHHDGRENATSTKIELPKNPAVMSLSDIFNTLGSLEDKKAAQSNQVDEEQPTAPEIVLIPEDHTGGPKVEHSIDVTDQYVKYDVQQPNGNRPQYVQYQGHQPNGHRPQPPSMDLGSQYVKYEVQQPQMNVVKFGSVPSMNSVVISPNQHSATFVLGSQQAVGSGAAAGGIPEGGHFVGSVSQEPTSAALNAPHATYHGMGQVLDDLKEHSTQIGSSVVNVQVKPQDIIKTTSVRFPSETDDKYDNAPIISGTHKSEVLPPNGHSAPVTQMVVFPPNNNIDSTLHEVSNRIVFDTTAASSSDTLNRNEVSIAPNPNYPADLPEQLTPPSAMLGPNMPYPSQPNSKRPRPPIPGQGPPYRYSEIQRRPYPSDRPRLPNILPQFRPNAKISQGHVHLKEAGTYRVPPGKVNPGPPLRRPYHDLTGASSQPSTQVRRVPMPTRFMIARPLTTSAEGKQDNRRYYRVPPPQPPPPQTQMIKDRIFNLQPTRLQPPPPPLVSRNSPASPQQPTTEKSTEPLEDNEFQRNPPQILQNILKDDLQQQNQRPKLEPVVTLQMLQAKKQQTSPQFPKADLDGISAASTLQSAASANNRENPVYVVYPVKSTPVKLEQTGGSDPIVVGLRGDQSPLPPSKISPGTEYQNTPFSIATHVEQEPILMAKHKKKPIGGAKLNFPYNLEKPDPQALAQFEEEELARKPEHHLPELDTLYNLGEEPMPQPEEHHDQHLISSKLQRVNADDSAPIAIAYTPTESTAVVGGKVRYNKGQPPRKNFYYSPYGETQTEVSYLKVNDDLDEFGNPSRRYEQNFQAPFQASISLDPVKVTNAYEGWAVVTSPPQALHQSQPAPVQKQPIESGVSNKIDRSDGEVNESESSSDKESATGGAVPPARFESNGFQPELQGGFRPIYGEDVKLSEQTNPDPQLRNAAVFDAEPTVEPAKPKDPVTTEAAKVEDEPAELDLEAFFDQMTKDYDDEDEDEAANRLDDVTLHDDLDLESNTDREVGRSGGSAAVTTLATTTTTTPAVATTTTTTPKPTEASKSNTEEKST